MRCAGRAAAWSRLGDVIGHVERKSFSSQDGSLFLSHVDIVSKLAACDCISSKQPNADDIGSNKYSGVALQLPSEPKQLALAAHSTGALTKGLLARCGPVKLPAVAFLLPNTDIREREVESPVIDFRSSVWTRNGT